MTLPKELQEILQAARTAQSDAKSARANLRKAPQDADSLRTDIAENVYPFLEKHARMFQKLVLQVAELDEAMAELEAPEDSFVTPELAEQLSAALAAGQVLSQELARLAPAIDELSRKRVEDAMRNHQRAADIAWQMVLDSMGEEVEGEEAEAAPVNGVNHEGDDDGDEEDEDDVDTVDLPAAAEAAAASEEVTNG